MMTSAFPRFPDVQVSLHTDNRWAIASAIRQALRRAGKDPHEIERFLDEALAHEDTEGFEAICRRWVRLATDH